MAQYSKELKSMLFKTLARGYRIQSKGNIIFRQIALDFVDIGLLSLLERKAVTIKELCHLSDLNRSEVTKRLNRLIKAGLANKHEVTKDRRMSQVLITKLGHNALKDALHEVNMPLDFAVAELTLNEEKAVLKYLSRLHQALKQFE